MALDPRIAALLWVAKRTNRSFRPDVSVEAFRKGYAETNRTLGVKAPPGVTVSQLSIPMDDGASIGARLYRPGAGDGGPLPVLLYFHGGGFVIGDVDCYGALTAFFAREGRIAVLSVDYRLGPEHRFPRGHEDAFGAFAWLQKHAADLDLRADGIAVGGDSAGGGLAAAISTYAESRGLARPAFAFLIYPAVDATGRFPSRREYTRDLPLTPESIAWFSEHVISAPSDVDNPLFVPLDAPHPERHPPAYILAARYDPLVDEGRAYYERLRDAGVPVTYDLRETLPHAFVNMAGAVPEARRALIDGIQATAAALGVHRVAVVTGAGSGIGRALAHELSQLGYELALADRNEQALAETVREVEGRAKVSAHTLDVSKKDEVDAFAARVLEEHGHVNVLINNAGVALAGSVEEVAIAEFEWLMNVNFWGTVYGVKAFLPALRRTGDATIVNVSSVFGLFGPPGQAAYAASKFAVRGFSEALRAEVRGAGINVLTAHPGGVKTNIARHARIAEAANRDVHIARGKKFEEVALTLPAREAALAIVRGIRLRKDRVLIGNDALRIDLITRVLGPAGSKYLGDRFIRGAKNP